MPTQHIEWATFSIGTIGTIAWACGYKYRSKPVEGWFWLASALLWIWFALANNHNGLAARDILGVALYVTGIVNSFRSKDKKEVAIAMAPDPSDKCAICVAASSKGPGSRELAMQAACESSRQSSGSSVCHWQR